MIKANSFSEIRRNSMQKPSFSLKSQPADSESIPDILIDPKTDLKPIKIDKANDLSSRFCIVCNNDQPIRAKHCLVCEKCVHRYDHHCTWLGNCIGERNHCFYYSYLSFQFAELFLSILYLAKNVQLSVFLIYSIVILIILAPVSLFSLFLLVLHTYLIVSGLTT